MPDFEPKILAFACNSAFFFGAKFSASLRFALLSAGSGSQRKTWGKKKLALTCSNFAFNINYLGTRRWTDA
ncbi:MAG: hypothetical protein V3U20_04580 [Thermoplasmata archaeon]